MFNVHPAKLEVRFQESGSSYSQLLGTLRSRFCRQTWRESAVEPQDVAGQAADDADPFDPFPARVAGHGSGL